MLETEFIPMARQYMDTVFRVAYSHLRCRADAEDVTQEVLLALYRREQPFENEEHAKHWLIRLTVNRCKSVFRAPWHRMEDISDYEDSLVFEEPRHREVFEAVMSLEQKYRLPVFLYYYEGYGVKEIGHLLKEPEGTISSRLSRARKKLKALLEGGNHGRQIQQRL